MTSDRLCCSFIRDRCAARQREKLFTRPVVLCFIWSSVQDRPLNSFTWASRSLVLLLSSSRSSCGSSLRSEGKLCQPLGQELLHRPSHNPKQFIRALKPLVWLSEPLSERSHWTFGLVSNHLKKSFWLCFFGDTPLFLSVFSPWCCSLAALAGCLFGGLPSAIWAAHPLLPRSPRILPTIPPRSLPRPRKAKLALEPVNLIWQHHSHWA